MSVATFDVPSELLVNRPTNFAASVPAGVTVEWDFAYNGPNFSSMATGTLNSRTFIAAGAFTVAARLSDGIHTPVIRTFAVTARAAQVLVQSAPGAFTTETGGKATFSVVLDSRPTANVTVPLATSAAGEGTADAIQLVFTPDNWNTPQTVTAIGIDDITRDGDQAYTIIVGPAASADGAFAGVDAAGVTLTNRDDERALVQSVVVNGGAVQRSTVTSLTVTFSTLVTLPANAADAFDLRSSTGSAVTVAVDLSLSTPPRTVARLTFPGLPVGSLLNGRYTLRVRTGLIADAFGQAAVSTSAAYLDLHRLYGDADGNRSVDAQDVTAFLNTYGASASNAAYRSYLDADGNGAVDAQDVTAFLNTYGITLP